MTPYASALRFCLPCTCSVEIIRSTYSILVGHNDCGNPLRLALAPQGILVNISDADEQKTACCDSQLNNGRVLQVMSQELRRGVKRRIEFRDVVRVRLFTLSDR